MQHTTCSTHTHTHTRTCVQHKYTCAKICQREREEGQHALTGALEVLPEGFGGKTGGVSLEAPKFCLAAADPLRGRGVGGDSKPCGLTPGESAVLRGRGTGWGFFLC